MPELLLELLPQLQLVLCSQLLQLPGELLRASLLLCSADLLRTGSDLQLHASDRVRSGYQLRAYVLNVQLPDLQLRSYLQLPDVLDVLVPDLQLPHLQLLVVQLLPEVELLPFELPFLKQLQVQEVS